jgi:hypothetical protein
MHAEWNKKLLSSCDMNKSINYQSP